MFIPGDFSRLQDQMNKRSRYADILTPLPDNIKWEEGPGIYIEPDKLEMIAKKKWGNDVFGPSWCFEREEWVFGHSSGGKSYYLDPKKAGEEFKPDKSGMYPPDYDEYFKKPDDDEDIEPISTEDIKAAFGKIAGFFKPGGLKKLKDEAAAAFKEMYSDEENEKDEDDALLDEVLNTKEDDDDDALLDEILNSKEDP